VIGLKIGFWIARSTRMIDFFSANFSRGLSPRRELQIRQAV
jgi:hypothetical protein